MKTYKVIYLIGFLTLTGCFDDGESPTACYLLNVTTLDGNSTLNQLEFNKQQLTKHNNWEMKYDAEGRLSEAVLVYSVPVVCKMAIKTFTYGENQIVETFNKIQSPCTANADGFYPYTSKYLLKGDKVIAKTRSDFQFDSTAYAYENDNLISVKTYLRNYPSNLFGLNELVLYEYDTKRNPWVVLKPLLYENTFSKNNVTKVTRLINNSYNEYSEWSEVYFYTYTSEGYPLTKEDVNTIVHYEYFCKN